MDKEVEDTDNQAPTLFGIHRVQQMHSVRLALLEQRGLAQQKSLDEINKGIKHLVWLFVGAFSLALANFIINGGLTAI